MKKLVAVVLVLVMMCGAALADEILFRGNPWGSKYSDVTAEMRYVGNWYDDEIHMIDWMNFDTDYSKEANGFNVLGHSIDEDFRVAGYSVNGISLLFLYSTNGVEVIKDIQDSELFGAQYSLQVMDLEIAYTDLKEKLSGLYGDGKEGKNEYGDMTFVTWTGDNDTAVKLITDNYGIYIRYGKTDDRILEELNAALIAEQQMAIKNDISGL